MDERSTRGLTRRHALRRTGALGLGAAVLWLAFLLWDLIRTWRTAQSRECRFLIRSSFLGIVGFVIAGVTEYTYGHALGLILFCFVAISPLILSRQLSRASSIRNASGQPCQPWKIHPATAGSISTKD